MMAFLGLVDELVQEKHFVQFLPKLLHFFPVFFHGLET